VNLFRFIPGYEEEIYRAGKEPLLLLLISFNRVVSVLGGFPHRPAHHH
jgi:hypothetical protein